MNPHAPIDAQSRRGRRDVFLHFINRDARDMYGMNSSWNDRDVLEWLRRYTIIGVCLADDFAFMPPGFVLEDSVAMRLIQDLEPLVRSQRVRFSIREPDFEDYESKKHVQYAAHPSRYQRLLARETVNEFKAIRPTWIRRETPVGASIASNWKRDMLWNGERRRGFQLQIPDRDIDRTAEVPTDILRSGRAVIWPEISGLLSPSISNSMRDDARSYLHYQYFSLYVLEYGAAVMSGLNMPRETFGLPPVDWPHYDARPFVSVLNRAGLVRDFVDSPVESFAALRETASFRLFMETYRKSLDAATAVNAEEAPRTTRKREFGASWHVRFARIWSAVEGESRRSEPLRTRLLRLVELVERAIEAIERPVASRTESSLLWTGPRTPVAVLLVHGIRTNAEWMEALKALLESHGHATETVNYGWVPLIEFIAPLPWVRDRFRDRLRQRMSEVIEVHGRGRVSIVAHSFGTYLVTQILESEQGLYIDRLLLCGAIVSEDTRWQHVQKYVTGGILNDCGARDRLPLLAFWCGLGYGATGVRGVNRSGVRDRFHDVGHSGFMTMEFARRFWIPYLTDGTVIPGIVDRGRMSYLWEATLWLPKLWIIVIGGAAILVLAWWCLP